MSGVRVFVVCRVVVKRNYFRMPRTVIEKTQMNDSDESAVFSKKPDR